MTFSSRLQTANIDKDNNNLDLLELIDWKLNNQNWF